MWPGLLRAAPPPPRPGAPPLHPPPSLRLRPILLLLRQDPALASVASDYLHACLPDLFLQSYLQFLTLPLTACMELSIALRLPINYLFVSAVPLGIGLCFDQPQYRRLPHNLHLPVEPPPPSVLQKLKVAPQPGRPQLRLGVPGVVVIRDRDHPLRSSPKLAGHRCLHGHPPSVYLCHLHLSVLAQLRRAHSDQQRAQCKPARRAAPVGLFW
ncbi:hypothetical protein OPV22_007318 [Ensete ventricosum]|uniref:Uncharacterized protein n=1 Tax=Ensete ventricosum TaxID=4639 RepID=A0A445M955_ENSVE|nr:hypothetical protein OPV22_007318 [Ensete ventricosum]RZR70769.1 hypothetical protein BHM03_00001349 [Ensete ventricosum]